MQQLQTKGTMSIHVTDCLKSRWTGLTAEEGRQESNDTEHFRDYVGLNKIMRSRQQIGKIGRQVERQKDWAIMSPFDDRTALAKEDGARVGLSSSFASFPVISPQ